MFRLTKATLTKAMRESRLRALHIFVISSEEFEAGYLSDIFVHSTWHYNKVGHVIIELQDKKKRLIMAVSV